MPIGPGDPPLSKYLHVQYGIIVIYILIEIEFGERATPNIESKSNCMLLELESSISSNTITSF